MSSTTPKAIHCVRIRGARKIGVVVERKISSSGDKSSSGFISDYRSKFSLQMNLCSLQINFCFHAVSLTPILQCTGRLLVRVTRILFSGLWALSFHSTGPDQSDGCAQGGIQREGHESLLSSTSHDVLFPLDFSYRVDFPRMPPDRRVFLLSSNREEVENNGTKFY